MSRVTHIQLFLFVLAMGFLMGPHVIQALQRLDITDGRNGGVVSGPPEPMLAAPVASEIRDPFADITLAAKSVYVWDVRAHRKLYERNAGERRPLASLTKMMTAFTASETLPESTLVTVLSADLMEEGDSGLYAGETWTLGKLSDFTLMTSSNDGASAIARIAGLSMATNTHAATPAEARGLFIAKMNEKARHMGLTETSFADESGLDLDRSTSGAYGSARDVAMLFDYIFRKHPEILRATAYASEDIRSESGFVHRAVNTNQNVQFVPGIIGSKTGFTDLAGGNLVIIADIGIDHPVVVVVLGSTYDGRFKDVETLLKAAQEAVSGIGA